MKVCAKCGTKIGRKDRFCSKCGGTSFNETSTKVKFCLYCGAVIDSKAKFCAKCGKSCEGDISLSFLDEKKAVPENVELDFLKKPEEQEKVELDFLKKQEEPAAELDFLKKSEEKEKEEQSFFKKQEVPAAELDFLKKQEEPEAELDFLKKQEEPEAELDFLKKQEEPKVELDFLKQAEEEKKKAEEEARKAEEEKKKAEEEAARKAEEERKKAEEEAARKAEEEKKKAEEEAARKAEEERKKAEEERKRKELEALRVEAVYAGKRALDKYKISEDSARVDLENVLDKFNEYYQKADEGEDNKEAEEISSGIKEVLGVIYYQEKSYKLAIPLLKEACAHNKNRAKIYVADWYLRNRKEFSGKPEDLKKDLEDALADEKLMKEHPEDRIKANMALARIFTDGIGVKKNQAEAFGYYLKCAELDDVEAMAMVGNCYLYGEGIKKDTKAAFPWNEKAAKAGNERAIRNLAVSYDFGTGVKKDAKKAIEWYKKLLEKIGNDRFAKFRIAMCLSDPDRDYGIKPTPEMYEEAISYAKQAIEEGEKNANYVLGYCYTYGKGVKADHGQGYTYYSKAASNGHQKAKTQLNSFVKTGMGNYVYRGI